MIHRLLIGVFAVIWLGSWGSGLRIFRQKLTQEYHPLPGLLKSHVTIGIGWAVLFALAGLSSLLGPTLFGPVGIAAVQDVAPFSLLSTLVTLLFVVVSTAVIYTGYGLQIGKPTGVWVHVFLAVASTGMGLILLSKHLWNGLS